MGAKHTSLEALAMSLKAGGGNLGTTFSTLTYSDMAAVVEGRVLRMRISGVVVMRARVKFCGKRKQLSRACQNAGPIVTQHATALYGPVSTTCISQRSNVTGHSLLKLGSFRCRDC